MIRILHIVGRMNRGGAETLLMNLYRHIDRSQIQFDFGVHDDLPGDFDDEIRSLDGRIIQLPRPHFTALPAYTRVLSAVLREEGPYVGVHSHVHSYSGYVLRTAGRVGIPLRLAHSHSTSDGKNGSVFRSAYRRTMRMQIHQWATHMLGCSPAACEALYGSDCWHDQRVQVLKNAIDLAQFAELTGEREELRKELGLPAKGKLIGHVGRFDPPKNHRFLLEVFAALLKKLPDAQLVLVGDGRLRPEIEQQVLRHGFGDQVTMLGVRSDVPRILSALDLFLFPSLYEGLGIALIEAQAAGIPSLVSTSITRVADVGLGLVHYLSLEEPIDSWVQRLLMLHSIPGQQWSARKKALETAGYDIRQVSRVLQEIYCHG